MSNDYLANLNIKPPILMSPARDWDCLRAAVNNGADAVYFGLDKYNARMRAQNFTFSELPEVLEFIHSRGVKGFLTFNTLVFTSELEEVFDLLVDVIKKGVDAIIVQDPGICRLIRWISPDIPIHASTQMTVTSFGGVIFARNLGCSIVGIARECSVQDIKQIYRELIQNLGTDSGIGLEVFVHGALCIAYSGQCLTSETIGGRSANRGVCAQACRLPYELICNERKVETKGKRFLLSPKDLAAIEVLPELIRAGISVVKIEGRLKRPEYVASVTRIYRKAIDLTVEFLKNQTLKRTNYGTTYGRLFNDSTEQAFINKLISESRYELEMAFSRGLGTGWLKGINNKALVHANFSNKRGPLLGKVLAVNQKQIITEALNNIKPGDGVLFCDENGSGEGTGGRVYSVKQLNSKTILEFGKNHIDFNLIRPNWTIWKTSDPALEKQLRQSFKGSWPHYTRPLNFFVNGSSGSKLSVLVEDDLGNSVLVESRSKLQKARQHPLTDIALKNQLGRLGGTPFHLGNFKNNLPQDVILPISELNQIRRYAVSEILKARSTPPKWQIENSTFKPIKERFLANKQIISSQKNCTLLSVLVRNLEQFEAAKECRVDEIYLEFKNKQMIEHALQLAGNQFFLRIVPPRICKPTEINYIAGLKSFAVSGFVSRNYDHLNIFSGLRQITDFSFNITNPIAATHLLEMYDVQRVTLGFDLDSNQIFDLIKTGDANKFEVVIHHHMPMFHMEYCLFCNFLSKGQSRANCGKPCEKNSLRLVDRVGEKHFVKSDLFCRNTIYHSRAQTGAYIIKDLINSRVGALRIELLNESKAQSVKTIEAYKALIKGNMKPDDLCELINAWPKLGISLNPQ